MYTLIDISNQMPEDSALDKDPHRTSRGKLKRCKRVALRCEKTKQNFTFIVALTAGFSLAKSTHTGWLS